MELSNNSRNIKAIDKTTVHRICSGQVVLNIATAVKELIENSLDAGATVIDIKLKEYGSELIEVVDNGVGVEAANFEGLTLKHHTSKLRDFSDLISVETFGFRGEALSSLCALSELSIVTRHESATCGTALYFDRNGHITERKQNARQVGTTVTLLNLFGSLPVRQKEFHKNLKREFNRMIQLLSAYCLVSTGVKITCVNQTKNNSRTTFLSTQGCKTVKENISCLFGAKQLPSLLEIKQRLPSNEVLTDLQASEDDCHNFTLEGYISSCAHGSGRGSNDRQFYFVNSRPCEPTKIMKQVNEVYHQFNVHQYPFVFLNINVTKGAVDVNVTPDKRKIFLTEEKLLLAIIKASILDLYDKIPSTFTYNNISLFTSKSLKSNETSDTDKPNFNKFDAWRHKTDGKRKNEGFIDENFPNKQIKMETKNIGVLERFGIQKSIKKSNEYSELKVTGNVSMDNSGSSEVDREVFKIKDNVVENTQSDASLSPIQQNTPLLKFSKKNEMHDEPSGHNDLDSSAQSSLALEDSAGIPEVKFEEITHQESQTACGSMEDVSLDQGIKSEQDISLKSTNTSQSIPDNSINNLIPIEFDTFEERRFRTVVVPVDINIIKESLNNRLTKTGFSTQKTTVRFRAVIDPTKNQQAETELNKEISKDMFEKMEIIGQFNLGFIIAKLDLDLFIIDQHATDEKYNFETLQQTTVISNQKLVSPQVLELTAANECVVIENISIFNKNGFEFLIDENAPPTKRVCLTAVPMSKNWVFGKDDIDELIFMLEDSPGANCRPSRVRAMFASRACRKSVMIGTALEKKDMRRLVNNMGTIEQPWNCPHGRPTMRHLVNLDLISSNLS